MAETGISEAERQQAAQAGLALPDGSYPVRDCDEVRRAREAYGRAPESHRPQLAALINHANREHGCGFKEFTPDE